MTGLAYPVFITWTAVGILSVATPALGSCAPDGARDGARIGVGATVGALASRADVGVHVGLGWSWGLTGAHSAEVGVRFGRRVFHASGLDIPLENLGLTSLAVRLLFLGGYHGGRRGVFWTMGAEILVMAADWRHDVGALPFAPADIRTWSGTSGGGGVVWGVGLSSSGRVELRALMSLFHISSLPSGGRRWYAPISLTALYRL